MAEKMITKVQLSRLEKYRERWGDDVLTAEDLIEAADITAEKAEEWIEDAKCNIEDVKEEIKERKENLRAGKEDFDNEVDYFRHEFLDSDLASLDKPWKDFGIRKPTVAAVRKTLKYLRETSPDWDNPPPLTEKVSYAENKDRHRKKEDIPRIFFSTCRNLNPELIQQPSKQASRKKSKKGDTTGCLSLIFLGIVAYYVWSHFLGK